MKKRVKPSNKTLRTLSMLVKGRSVDGKTCFRNRDFFKIHDRLIEAYRDTKRLEGRPEPTLEMLERWAEEWE